MPGGGGGGTSRSVGRACDSWWGHPGIDPHCGRRLPTGWVCVSIMWLAALSHVWQHLKFSDVSLGAHPLYSLVVEEDVKKQTNCVLPIHVLYTFPCSCQSNTYCSYCCLSELSKSLHLKIMSSYTEIHRAIIVLLFFFPIFANRDKHSFVLPDLWPATLASESRGSAQCCPAWHYSSVHSGWTRWPVNYGQA